jgi:hypothetical protein
VTSVNFQRSEVLLVIAELTCVRQVQQIGHVERALAGFQANSSIPLFDRK